MSIFGENLRTLRKEKGISQQGLSEQINVTRLTISNYEQGRREPDFETLCAFADYFDCSVDFLLGRMRARSNDDAVKLERGTTEFQSKLQNLPPNEREFILLTLNNLLDNHTALSDLQEYRRQQLFSILALNLSSNTYTNFIVEVKRLLSESEGTQAFSGRIPDLIDMSYKTKIDMVKTVDAMHNLFLSELSALAKKEGIQEDVFPDTRDSSSLTKDMFERLFLWQGNK